MTDGGVRNLDEPCGVCRRPAGDHTLREWSACLGATTTDVPYHELPTGAAAEITAEMRRRFALERDVILADTVVVRAAVVDGASGVVAIKAPALIHEFQVSLPNGRETVAKVMFIGNVDTVRGYGRLVRESADGAASAADG